MNLDGALYEKLTDTLAIANLIGIQVFPAGSVPQSASGRYLTLQRVDDAREGHQGGGTDLRQAQYILRVVARPDQTATTFTDPRKLAQDLSELVRTALDYFTGTMGTGGNATDIDSLVIETGREVVERPQDGSARGVHVVALDVAVWYRTS